MKKQDLYNLINDRFKKSVQDLYEKYKTEQEVLAEEYFEQIKDQITPVSKKIDELSKGIANLNLFGIVGDYAYNGYTAEVRRLGEANKNFEEHMKTVIDNRFRGTVPIKLTDAYNHSDVSEKYFTLHNKCYLWYTEEKDKLRTLHKELTHVVKVFPSAKKAAEKLKELGLDLSGIEEISADNLPAVIKTSVDVCLFNKQGCK